MSIDLAGFEAGDHILLLTVETEDGRTAQANIPFRVVAGKLNNLYSAQYCSIDGKSIIGNHYYQIWRLYLKH